MQAELEALDKALGNPKRPVCAVVGGAKVSTKLDLLGNLVGKVDKLIIGGGMANTFMHAQGIKVGKSLSREGPRQRRRSRSWRRRRPPSARCCCRSTSWSRPSSRPAPRSKVVDADACPDDQMILDVGPKSIALYQKEVAECATLVWNGPLGAFEIKPFDTGTVALAQDVARADQRQASCCRSRAAATRWRRWRRRASRRNSPTSRRRAAPSSNGWKARPCPALQR